MEQSNRNLKMDLQNTDGSLEKYRKVFKHVMQFVKNSPIISENNKEIVYLIGDKYYECKFQHRDPFFYVEITKDNLPCEIRFNVNDHINAKCQLVKLSSLIDFMSVTIDDAVRTLDQHGAPSQLPGQSMASSNQFPNKDSRLSNTYSSEPGDAIPDVYGTTDAWISYSQQAPSSRTNMSSQINPTNNFIFGPRQLTYTPPDSCSSENYSFQQQSIYSQQQSIHPQQQQQQPTFTQNTQYSLQGYLPQLHQPTNTQRGHYQSQDHFSQQQSIYSPTDQYPLQDCFSQQQQQQPMFAQTAQYPSQDYSFQQSQQFPSQTGEDTVQNGNYNR